jgi:rRNA maturation protein Nop10
MSDSCQTCGTPWKYHGTGCNYNPNTNIQPYKCPVCNGSGKVSRPPHVAGDVDQWSASGTELYECNACLGSGIVWR